MEESEEHLFIITWETKKKTKYQINIQEIKTEMKKNKKPLKKIFCILN